MWICTRQVTWQPVESQKMWRGPLVFVVFGLVSLNSARVSVTPLDVVIIGVEAAVAAGAGYLMGVLTRFRPVTDETRRRMMARRRQPRGPVTTESRTGWTGLLLWFAVIAVRVGLGFLSHDLGLELASAFGTIFLAIGLNRAARALVITSRLNRQPVRVR